jgi:hypothetical protein
MWCLWSKSDNYNSFILRKIAFGPLHLGVTWHYFVKLRCLHCVCGHKVVEITAIMPAVPSPSEFVSVDAGLLGCKAVWTCTFL